MKIRKEVEKCPNCGAAAIDIYCSSCGQKIYRKRFSLKGFFEVVGSALNIDRGFIHTLIWLFTNPGRIINDYLNGKTKSYFNPLNYILIVGGIYAFLVLSLNILDSSIASTNQILQNENMQASPEALELQQRWVETIKKYVNFIPLLMIPFASLFSKWYYHKRKLYYGEHLILNTFIFAQSILISVVVSPLVLVIPGMLEIYPLINFSLSLLYFTYALFSIFKKSVLKAFSGAVTIFLGGFVFFMLFVVVTVVTGMILLNLLGVEMKDLVS
jgi:hypothetical protein